MSARGMVSLAPLAFLCALTLFPGSASAAGARECREQVLPGCGICYPGGYDINTVGDVQGRVAEIEVPAEGPVRFVIAAERERWVVLASPVWFWKNTGLRLVPGYSVTVRGSKSLGADGTLYLVAGEIDPQGSAPVVVLRDRRGVPLWSGMHQGRPRRSQPLGPHPDQTGFPPASRRITTDAAPATVISRDTR